MKTKEFFGAVLTVMCAMTVLTACTDNYDTPEEPASAVDHGEWLLREEYMDTSVRPGDDFFMYCNGGFWNATSVNEDLVELQSWNTKEVPDAINQRLSSLHLPSLEKMQADAYKTDDATIALQKQDLQSAIDCIESLTTTEEAAHLAARLMKEGYNVPFSLATFSKNGKIAVALQLTTQNHYKAGQVKSDNFEWQLGNNPKKLSAVRPVMGNATRSIDETQWPNLKIMFEELDIPLEYAYTIDEHPDATPEGSGQQTMYLGFLQEEDVSAWKTLMKQMITADAALFDDTSLEQFNQTQPTPLTRQDMITNFSNNYLLYERAHIFSEAFVTPDMKQQTMELCKQMRETFRQRIASNEWMSDASKQSAREKLDAMTFNVGSPDEWFEEGLPDISQEPSLFDDVRAVRRANLNLSRRLIGMEAPRASFHMIIVNHDLTAVNAFYMPNTNSMNIFPAWMMEPYTNPNNNEAHNYATFSVIGHEITHGFDTNGSKYNKIGDLEDIWASDADRLEFLRRAQLLIDCYNELEVMPWALPGLKNDGAYTIRENIADLGGFLMAYDTYVKYLRDNGFTGEQFDLQRKRFYMAYVWLWHCRYSVKYAQVRTLGEGDHAAGKDYHSLLRERTNGVVMNTDDWYDLFDVKDSDKLYRTSEERIRIW